MRIIWGVHDEQWPKLVKAVAMAWKSHKPQTRSRLCFAAITVGSNPNHSGPFPILQLFKVILTKYGSATLPTYSGDIQYHITLITVRYRRTRGSGKGCTAYRAVPSLAERGGHHAGF